MHNTTPHQGDPEIYQPREGYDCASTYYEKWHWFEFWQRNEAPIVREWLTGLKRGLLLDIGSGTGPYHCEVETLGHQYVSADVSMASAVTQNRPMKVT